MNHKLLCTTAQKATSYTIEIHKDLLDQPDFLFQQLSPLGSRFVIISDKVVADLHGNKFQKSLAQLGLKASLFSFPNGEQNKTRATKDQLENQLFEKGFGRDICIIALGGGVSTDLGGYLAATYCRGVPLVMIPTSLLGMVDASIGGKTGLNVPYGKNLVGSIYQPKKVLIDPSTLQSLPLKELRNGVVEMIKHGLILDNAHFNYLNEHADRILALDSTILEKAILDSCCIKRRIVEQDEKEGGIRNLLNFGHTVGHALEHMTHYSLTHGEAVAIGILVESHLALQLGHLNLKDFDMILSIFKKYGLPLQLPTSPSIPDLLKGMTLDKKSLKGKPRFVMIHAIGSALTCDEAYCMPVEENVLINALNWMNNDLCCH
ncbi:MAG: 3-dehydroquinate synthase [Parachlamydiaceae bacterium]|nr:3-dehydroquinate synthase [Parachlamydiaceae bacterium]